MFLPRLQLNLYDPVAKEKYCVRWQSLKNKKYVDLVDKLIENGAGEDFLQSSYEYGELPIIEDMYDLKGYNLFSKKINFPSEDNFEGINFSYSNFYHSTLNNGVFICTFDFSDFHNTQFVNCNFIHCSFLGANFSKCEFIDCNFSDFNYLTYTSFSDTKFKSCFFSDRSFFDDCKFSNDVIFEDIQFKSSFRANDRIPDSRKADLFTSISNCYLSGNAKVNAEDFYLKGRKASTRHNSSGVLDQTLQFIQELIVGYGARPFRALLTLILLYCIATFTFLFYIPTLAPKDAIIFTAGSIFTFGGFGNILEELPLDLRVVYIMFSFLGISATAIFITSLATKWLK